MRRSGYSGACNGGGRSRGVPHASPAAGGFGRKAARRDLGVAGAQGGADAPCTHARRLRALRAQGQMPGRLPGPGRAGFGRARRFMRIGTQGVKMIYLDNAASSHPKPPEVYEAADRALRLGANPGRSGHRSALDAARLIFDARDRVATLLGVRDASRVVFTANATHALNQVFRPAGTRRPRHYLLHGAQQRASPPLRAERAGR